MRAIRNMSLAASGAVALIACALAAAPAAHAVTQPGDPCPTAGFTVHVGNTDLRCTLKGGTLVWTPLTQQGGGSGSASGGGISSNASIPKVIQNWGLALKPYDPATGKAGVMRIAGVTPPTFSNAADTAAYSHIVGLYGEQMKGVQEPQMAFMAPLGTPVISMVDGTVCDVPKLYSKDYSVRVAPTGTPCSAGGAAILFEHEHLLKPLVKVGDSVKAGQRIGTVSNYNAQWKSKGLGTIETGVFFMKNDAGGKPWHACLANYLAPSASSGMIATLTSIEKAWNTQRKDPSLYSLAAQNPVGCLTQQDITDSNSGQQ
jgi:biotin carboxyl carrier protein